MPAPQIFTGLCIIRNRSARHFDNDIISVLAETFVTAAVTSVLCKSMTFIPQMQQCPVIAVSLQDNATALTAIAAIGATIRNILVMTQVRRASAALA